ncbi:ABC transporter permease [Flavobacterium sp.]|uniref:ABC transporter permease n=1 Tax=Flavobacterium sp. TaxID=239 RepID=UPI0035287152
MIDYFELQYVLTNRKIKEARINPFLGYVLGLTAFVLLSEYIFHKTEFAKYLVILTCLSLQLKLSEKNRTDFLLSTFGDITKMKIRIIENFIFCIPFVSILIYKSFFFEASILFLSSSILALVSFHTSINFTIPTPFSKSPFEFSTGFRKTVFLMPVAYALTVIAINVDNLNLGIFAFLLVFLTSLSYYHKPEQEYYVWIFAETPKRFLKNKVFNAIRNASILVAPIVISLLIFYPNEFELILLFFIIGLLFLCTIILAKYSAYPGEMNIPEGILIAFSLYFPPLLLANIPFFYSKSINKLKYLLND